MSYIEIKTIKGCKYKYERVSYRIGDKVKHTSKYLGPVKPKYKGKIKRRIKNGIQKDY